MSEDQDLSPASGALRDLSPSEGDTEEVDALPVPDDGGRARVPVLAAALSKPLAELRAPAIQAAAIAAGGFVAGAAVVGLARRRSGASQSARRVLRCGSRRSRRQGERLEIVASKSLLVDLHLLGPEGRGR